VKHSAVDAETVRVNEPGVAFEAAVSVKVLVPLPGLAMLAGLKAAVTPLGKPLTDKVSDA
jgi:hypothetical protein